MYLTETFSDVVPMAIIAAIALLAVIWHYVGWWLAVPIAALGAYRLLLRRDPRRGARKG
jgi:hypothetical protein